MSGKAEMSSHEMSIRMMRAIVEAFGLHGRRIRKITLVSEIGVPPLLITEEYLNVPGDAEMGKFGTVLKTYRLEEGEKDGNGDDPRLEDPAGRDASPDRPRRE
jgi:hypothetical protein